MPGGRAAVQIPVALDKREAERNAKELQQSIIGSLTPVVDVGSLVARTFDVVSTTLKDIVGAAIEAETAQLKLATALRVAGHDVEGNLQRLDAFNAVLLQSTGIADETLLGLESLFASLRLSPREFETATRAAIGLSEVTGKDLLSAGQDLAKLYLGDVPKSLKTFGFEAGDAAEAITYLTGFVADAEERTKTFGGQLHLLSENYGELQESIGAVITQSGSLTGSLQRLNEAFSGMPRAMDAWLARLEQVKGAFEGMRNPIKDIDALLTKVFPVLGVKVPEPEDIFGTGFKLYQDDLTLLNNLLDSTAKKGREVKEELAKVTPGSEGFVGPPRPPEVGAGTKGKKRAKGAAGSLEDQLTDQARVILEADNDTVRALDMHLELVRRYGEEKVAAVIQFNEQTLSDEVAHAGRVLGVQEEFAIAQADLDRQLRGLRQADEIAENERHFQQLVEQYDEQQQRMQYLADRQSADDFAYKVAYHEKIQQLHADFGVQLTSNQETILSGFTTMGLDAAKIGLSSIGPAISGTIGALAQAAAQGEDAGDAIRATLGTLISSIGQSILGMGSAALVSATLGGFFPFLRIAGSGGPEGIPAALAAMAVGGTLVGIGTAMGGGAGAPATRPAVPGGGGGGGGSFGGGTGADFNRAPSTFPGAGGAQTINVTVQGGNFFGQSEREVKRAMADAVREGLGGRL